jgi:uncharacterized membrane protein
MRIRAIDWLRGLVMILMTVDHSGSQLDAAHMHGDNGAQWVPGSPLPAGEFLTRWITHLCAPTFVLLAGASLALSADKRQGKPGQLRFIVTRGLFIVALDPLWMTLAFTEYRALVFQVLYAIGMSLVCMAALRRLPSKALLAGAIAIQLGGELSVHVQPVTQPWHAIWGFLFAGGPVMNRVVCGYPLVPWLSIMMLGWVLGRWMTEPRPQAVRARSLALIGAALLGVFAVVRGVDRYGNWELHRDSAAPLQWLHVAKYPPSLAYSSLELGIAFLLLAGFFVLDDPRLPRRLLSPLSLYGATAFFFYLLHVHILWAAMRVFAIDRQHHGLAKTWIGAAATIALLAWPCWRYRRYKAAHPDGWARYL